MKRFLILLSLTAALFTGRAAAQNDSLKALEAFAKGIEALQTEKYDTTIFYMREALELIEGYQFGSDGGLIHYFIAESFRTLGNYDSAYVHLGAGREIMEAYNNIPGLAYFDKCEADIQNSLGNFIRSEELYYIALKNLPVSDDPVTAAYIYTSLANIVLNRGENGSATELFGQAEKYYRLANYEPGLGDVYYGYGLIATNTNDNPLADSLFDVSLSIFTKYNLTLGIANAWYGKGIVAMNLGKNKLSIIASSKALELYKQVNYPMGIANTHTNIAMVSINTADYENAEKNFNAALPWLEKINYLIGFGNVYYGLGIMAMNLAENDEAERYYGLAIDAYTKTGYSLGLGRIYHGLSVIAINKGDNKKAEEMAKTAVDYYEKAGFLIGMGQVYDNFGNIFLNAGNNERSEENFKKALQYYEKAGYPVGLGNIWFSLSQLSYMTLDFAATRARIDSSLNYFNKAQYPLGLGNSWFMLSQIAQFEENYQEGIDYDMKALAEFEKINYPLGIGRVCYSVGTALYRLGEYEEAEKQYKAALEVFTLSEYNFFCVITSFSLADLYLGWKPKEQMTVQYLDQAMKYLEDFRANLVREEDRTSLFEKFSAYLEFSVYAAIYMKDSQSAFRFLENVKGRSLADILSERAADLSAKVDASLLRQRAALEKQIANLKTLLNTSGDADGVSVKAELKNLNDQLDDLVFKIKSQNPDFASLEYPKPAEVTEIQSKLGKDETLLQYFISDYGAWVFVMTGSDFELVKLDSNSTAISENAVTLLDGLKRDKYTVAKPAAEMDAEEEMSLEASLKLYDLLIKPVESRLKPGSRLVVIPSGVLNFIPFEALYSGSSFLIEKYPVKYYQSATLLTLKRGSLKKERNSKGFAGFGDPVYDIENFEKGMEERGVKLGYRGTGLEFEESKSEISRAGLTLFRLRGTGEEINAIADLFKAKGQPVDVKLRKDATEENAKAAELKNFGYISFACHGIVYPGFQSLALCTVKDSVNGAQDGYLTFEEILALDWNAKLVVLSACQTGTGDMKKTEGIVGLTRAVMYAGTDAVLVSLWTVSDAGTRDLMINLFTSIVNDSLPTDESLRLAKLTLIRKGTTPYIWSPFVVFGD
ncbi:MAG: hypothetical protein AMXMBFR49_29710 [Chlorobiota bacterium]